jgi:two-component system OmpR family sensor kinase
LRAAVVTELARLGALLGGPVRLSRSTGGYPVHRVVRDVVLVWGATGMRIDLDVDPELRVEGSPDVLAQVLTNVIANCARHAPGSPVRVRAALSGQRVRLSVSDTGPGLRGLSEREAFDRRARGPASPGQGLGLYLCRELLARDGGSICIRPARRHQPGCTMGIDLAAASPARPRPARATTPSPVPRPIPGALPSPV